MSDGSPLGLFCDLTALDRAQRERRAELAGLIRAGTLGITETPEGYSLHLPRTDAVVRQAEELIGLERRCCSFLTLAVTDDAATGDVVLEISGGEGAKGFIAAELGVLDERGR